MFFDQTSAHHHHHHHHHQRQQQHQQPQQHQHQHQHQQYQHYHHHHQNQHHQHQHHPGKAPEREDLEDPEGRRDYCYLGDLGKSAQHTFKQGGVERALEFGEPASAVAASDLDSVRDEWLSAMDDSTAMLFDDATSTATTTIHLELVGACYASAAMASASAATASPSLSSSLSSLSPPSSPSMFLPSSSLSSPSSSVGPVSATAATAVTAAAEATVAVATAPEQTRDFFLASVTGHGGDFAAADWLADMGVDTVGGGGGSGGSCFGRDVGVGVSMGAAFRLDGGGRASAPSCEPIGDEMLPPEARPPWEKATTAQSRFVTCESVLPLPKPLPKARQASQASATCRRFPTSEIDPANLRESSTGRLRRGTGLPR